MIDDVFAAIAYTLKRFRRAGNGVDLRHIVKCLHTDEAAASPLAGLTATTRNYAWLPIHRYAEVAART